MTDSTFDTRLASQLRGYAEGGVRPVSALDVAERAITVPRGRGTVRSGLTLLAAAFVLVGGAIIGLAIGANRNPEPSGSIAYSYDDGNQRSVWRIGVPEKTATEIVRLQQAASIAPDGRHAIWLTFSQGAAGQTDQLHIVNVATGDEVAVQPGGDVYGASFYPFPGTVFSWSPGGRWVAWIACDASSNCAYVVSATDGSKRRVLEQTFPYARARNTSVTWPSDDRLVVYIQGHGFLETDPAGSGLTLFNRRLADSPDGRWSTYGSGSELNVTALDGTPRSHVSFGGGEEPFSWAWAPDSSMVAVVLGVDPTRAGRLALMDLDGHWTRADLMEGAIGGTVRWAPDGSRLYVSVAGGTGAIVGRDGRLISNLGNATIGAWSPDSRHLAVAGGDFDAVNLVDRDGSNRTDAGTRVFGPIDRLVWTP